MAPKGTMHDWWCLDGAGSSVLSMSLCRCTGPARNCNSLCFKASKSSYDRRHCNYVKQGSFWSTALPAGIYLHNGGSSDAGEVKRPNSSTYRHCRSERHTESSTFELAALISAYAKTRLANVSRWTKPQERELYWDICHFKEDFLVWLRSARRSSRWIPGSFSFANEIMQILPVCHLSLLLQGQMTE
jgi:hypothetical protein